MLSAANRMRRSEDFRLTVRKGRRSGRSGVVVHWWEADVSSPTFSADGAEVVLPDADVQVGFVVGRSVGSAVVRNTVQRRLRHLMRARLADLPAGCKVVVRATPSAADASSATLAHELDAALHRVRRGSAPRDRSRR